MVTKLDTQLMAAGRGCDNFEALAIQVDDCSTRHDGCLTCRSRTECRRTWDTMVNMPKLTTSHFVQFMSQFKELEGRSMAVVETVAIMLVVSVGGIYSMWG